MLSAEEHDYLASRLAVILDTADLRRELKISKRTLRRLIRRRRAVGLELYRVDGKIQCNRDDFLRFLARNSNL